MNHYDFTDYFSNNPLLQSLLAYTRSDAYPFHMPGHKRNTAYSGIQFPNPYSIDITEISGFDNLHHADGILKDSMDHAAALYGADKSYYLVNGSTCGILSAISACVSPGGKILISRNCHKSVYHGIFLNELYAEYIYPQVVLSLGIQGGILPEDVEKQLELHTDIQAVLLVSPTYDGIVSDIGKISEIVHRHGRVLIVDEAHGAHFPFGNHEEFPVSALDKGADIVIQSLHKTLPCLTQTAIIHVKQGYLTKEQEERLEFFLSVYQSSSPSYVLMAGIEAGLAFMEKEGRKALSRLYGWLEDFRVRGRELKKIYLPGKELERSNGIYAVDSSKIIMVLADEGVSGVWLDDYLRREYSLEMEMCAPRYVLALCSVMDKQEGLERLLSALYSADAILLKRIENPLLKNIKKSRYINKRKNYPKTVYSIAETAKRKKENHYLRECKGEVTAEYIYLYPPGIPLLVPGERITEEIIQEIENYLYMGLSVQGLADTQGKRINIVR